MSRISSGSGWRDWTPMPSGPMEPASRTSREADSRASRAILTPRPLRRCTSSPRPMGASLKRFAPNVLVSMICAPASMYAWCTRKTASGSVAFSSSKQRCEPTTSCSTEPIAPSAIRMESFSRSLRSSIFNFCTSCPWGCRREKFPSALLIHEAGDGTHEVVLGENLETRFAHFDEHGGILVTQNVCHALDGRGPGYLRQRLAHHFADDQFAQVFPLQRQMQNLVFVDGSHREIFLEHRDLRDVLLLHGLQRVKDGLIGPRNHQLAYFAGSMFGVDHFLGGDLHGGIDVASLAPPFVVVDLAAIAHARVRKKRDDESLRAEVLGQAQRGGDAAASGTSGEQAFHFHQAPRHDEAFFVVDLEHIVDNLQIHRGGKKILADTFHDV